jgi:TPR repeat protein|mmetsp:Transcript_3950/g.7294  ORF Transcript_3950/g.7294 Transcript_3950/m.7294 type:complete len:101 (+) Transcript_3950:977-1279(+)
MARHYFELAAKQGCAEAQCNLVLFYSKGYGAEQDYEKAKQYLDLAANQGDGTVSEQLHLGHIFHGGLYGNMHAVNRTEDCDELPREHGPDIKDASCQNKL